jgi:hypothetical protein
MAQDHLVIERAIDQPRILDVAEIAHHVAIIERAGLTSTSATALCPCGCLQMPS